MDIAGKTDEELYEIAKPWWEELIKYSNNRNYLMFIKNFSRSLRDGANEMEIGKQFARSDLAHNLSKEYEVIGTIRRGEHVTVLFKQRHKKREGEWLGRMVLGIEDDDEVKIFGVSLF
jgi:hypothetical protein